jgi:structural maintenance of chromosome 2
LKREEKSAENLAINKSKATEKLVVIEKKLAEVDFSQTEYDKLDHEKRDLEGVVKSLKDTVATLTAQIQGRLSFEYTDPVRGFDRTKVKGVVAKLVNVPLKENSTALEVVAGGKLFQVVVDEAITGKALLSRGKLQRRVTIIPLDKIQAKRITNSAMCDAQNIARKMNSTVYPAIELLTFDEEVRGAIEYVFGSSFVVDNAEVANKICDSTHTRTVTLEGDSYDPSGTISGGSKDNFGNTLSQLSLLADVKVELKDAEKRLEKVVQRFDGMRNNFKTYEKLSMEMEVANAELEFVNKHISQTSYGMLLDKFNTMTAEIEEASQEAEAMTKEKEAKWDLYHHLKEKEMELTRQRELKLSGIESEVASAKLSVTDAARLTRDVSCL